MIKAIIFDWAGVMSTDAGWVWLRKNIKDLDARKPIFDKASEDVDSATITHDEFLEFNAKESGKSVDQVSREVQNEVVINSELVLYIKKLKQKYKVALLSNYTYPWLAEILDENNLWGLFDKNIISSEHKIIKPNPEIFIKMLEMLEIRPEEAVFIDDRQINVDGARKVGINSILFENNEQLFLDLKNLRVEI